MSDPTPVAVADSPDDLDDLAAELDDDTADPAAADAAVDAYTPPTFYGGIIDDGPPPYPGKLMISRFPKGVLLVDPTAGRAWVLDFDAAGGRFRCRDAAGVVLDEASRWRAAEEGDYDVRAYDPEFAGDTAPGAADIGVDAGGVDYGQAPA